MTTIYEGAAADGMNERGLVANLLYLPESKYPARGPQRQAPDAAQFRLGAIRARHLCDDGRSGGGPAQGRVPHGSHRRANRRAGHGASVHFRRFRRFSHLRISRRQARHSSRAAVSGDDQLAPVPGSVGHREILGDHRRRDNAAGHQSRHGPLRARASYTSRRPRNPPILASPLQLSSASCAT